MGKNFSAKCCGWPGIQKVWTSVLGARCITAAWEVPGTSIFL